MTQENENTNDQEDPSPAKEKPASRKPWHLFAVAGTTLFAAFAGSLYFALLMHYEEEVAKRSTSSRQTVTAGAGTTVRVQPQMQTFQVAAPVGKRSEATPALPRHCLDWSPAPPFSTADFKVFVNGKPTRSEDFANGGIITKGAYVQFKSTLDKPVLLNMVRWPMPSDKKC